MFGAIPRTRARWRDGRRSVRSGRFALEQKGLDAFLHNFATLVQHLKLPLHDAAFGVRCFPLLQDLQSGVNRVARLDWFGEFQAVEAEKRDQRVVVEMKLEKQAGGNRVDEGAVRDTTAELRLFAVLFIDVQRIVIA